MTASMALMDRKPRLALVPPVAEPTISAGAAEGTGGIWSWIKEAPGRFWGWLKRTLHLQPLIDKVKAGAAWVVSLVKELGVSGMSGLGLLTVTTGVGRWLLKTFVATPINWVGSLFGSVWRGLSNFFADNLGGFGDWMAARMGDVEGFFWGTFDLDEHGHIVVGKTGLFPSIGNWYRQHIAPHLELGSVLMRGLRMLGTALFGLQLIAALPLFGLVGSALTYATYGAQVVLYGSLLWQSFFLGVRIGEIPEVNEWINKNRGTTVGSEHSVKGKVSFAGTPAAEPVADAKARG